MPKPKDVGMASKAGTSKNTRRSPKASSSRKRKIEESPVAASELKRNCIEKKSVADKYCWMCHKLGQDEKCFICPRVYHSLCLKKASNVFSEEGVCPECQLNSVDGTMLSKNLTCLRLKELLLAATIQRKNALTKQKKNGNSEKGLGINDIFLKWPGNIKSDQLVRVMDFVILIDNINDNLPYTKTSEFFSDVKWIQHNCFILYGANSKVTDAAIKLVKAFKTDLLDLEACPECYYHMLCYNSPDFFVRICNPPHDIIWAQVSGYPYWPAKCLKVVGGTAHVRFFGRHEMGDIPISQCYFISKEHPNQPQRSAPKTLKYNNAINELLEYVELYERTYGVNSFHYYKGKTAFKPENAVPKLSKDTPEEDVPVSNSKPNITAIPLCIDPIAQEEERADRSESSEQSRNNSVPIISKPVAVSMTFSEEQSKSNDFDSVNSFESVPLDSSFDPVPPIDIQSCTATTVVDSTPVLAAADSVINMSSDDLSLGAEFSNSNPASQPSVNEDTNNDIHHLSKTSQILLKAVCNINERVNDNSSKNTLFGISCDKDLDLFNLMEMISRSTGHCKGCSKSSTSKHNAADPNDPIDDDDITKLDSLGPLSHVTSSQIENSLMVRYLSRGEMLQNVSSNFKSLLYNLFINMWSLANSSPTSAEVLATVIMDLKKQHEMLLKLKKDNDDLKQCAMCAKLSASLEGEKRKNEDLRVEFNDVTKNAKLVVDSVKCSSDNLWSKKFKEYAAVYNEKLTEKEHTILECKKRLERLQADYNALEAQKVVIENMYNKTLNKHGQLPPSQQFCASSQTELLSSEVFDKTELQNMLEKNATFIKRSVELDLNEQIKEAKRNSYCYICYKPATIHCCLNACYCTKACQKKHWTPGTSGYTPHSKSCTRQQEGRAHQESEIAHQLNQTQTIARKTTSIHLQFEESSDVVTTTSSDGYIYPSASTSTSVSTNDNS